MLESFFHKVAGLRLTTLLKKRLRNSQLCESFKNIFFTEHLRETASEENLFLESCSCFLTHIYIKRDHFRFKAIGDLNSVLEQRL